MFKQSFLSVIYSIAFFSYIKIYFNDFVHAVLFILICIFLKSNKNHSIVKMGLAESHSRAIDMNNKYKRNVEAKTFLV